MRKFYLLDNTFVVPEEEYYSLSLSNKIVKEYEVNTNCELLDSEVSLKLEAYANKQTDHPVWLH